jgi:hypothetical protein
MRTERSPHERDTEGEAQADADILLTAFAPKV